MKADFDRKGEYADEELEFLNLEQQLEISEKEAKQWKKSGLFFEFKPHLKNYHLNKVQLKF